ncbi:MAG: S8 family serine peptidase [Acidobacteriia bacterium]|nr:S8 family serine peptidase [Terriglobia bacterium]
MPSTEKVTPVTFYLNEQHELSRGEREGGGRFPQYHGIDWAAKGKRIVAALESVRTALTASHDPLSDRHYFVLAKAVPSIAKQSTNKRLAKDGVISSQVRFDEDDSRVFRRLGMDLVEVTADGSAVVHIEPERVKQLVATTQRLDEVGAREQARWASLDSFGIIPSELRLNEDWVRSLRSHVAVDAVVEFQPLLSRSDIEVLLRAISSVLKPDRKEGITGIGTDFSGRFWARGRLSPEGLRAIAKSFYSIQTLHSPLTSFVFATKGRNPSKPSEVKALPAQTDVTKLPTVAILDTGVPSNHGILAPFRRGAFVASDSYGQAVGDHGSFVASRIVFGDVETEDGMPTNPQGTCRYYDALVATAINKIDDKSVVPAIQTVVQTAPDVRVFNLSFDTRPLDELDATKRRENLILVQDLDNLIFRDDILVVVSSGNSPEGVAPADPYPSNYTDPNWRLGAWARSFNSLTCGSYVGRLVPGGLATNLGWPSPFARVGPGLCESPKPDFSAHGGNASSTMQFAPGLGVFGLTATGLWEDRCGTSFAAPVLARETAFAIHNLQKVCLSGARPYAVTVKAFLALTAIPHGLSGVVKTLADRSLGRGKASIERLMKPISDRAVLLWQGLLEGPGELARVMVPIPKDWYNKAKKPTLRLVVSWDSPVNAAVSGLWATRKVAAQLKASPDTLSLHGTRGGHPSYPLIDRTYDLLRLPKGVVVDGDMWLVELSYEQIADYHLGMVFTPQQRVAFAAELFDDTDTPIGPQAALHALPAASTMTRLSIPPQSVKTPVIIRPIG